MENNNLSSEHISVLADEIVEHVHLARDGTVVDATLGHGGHSVLLGSQLGPDGLLLGLDVDQNCIARARTFLSSLDCRVVLVRENFENLEKVLDDEGIEGVDLILADIGFCSGQLNDPKRGLSFQQNMPLDMRLDDRRKITAADIINNTDEKELADLIFKYGEERASRRIARSIVEDRGRRKITSTGQLASIICKALNRPMAGYSSKVHPATRVFQALRIAVNDELGCLERLLASAVKVLKKGGVAAIISFHSLEDRIVKNDFKRNSKSGAYEIITKKPIVASKEEMAGNIRARSAKLRMARKI